MSRRRLIPKRAVLGRIVAAAGLASILLAGCTNPDALPEPTLQPAADPARFSSEIAAFARADAKTPSPPNVALFVGSSSIRMWPLETSFPETSVVNRGFGGSQFSDAIHYADALFGPHTPSVIVLYEGDNDIAAGLTPVQVRDHYRIMRETIRAHHPAVPVLFLSIKPSPRRSEMWPDMQVANNMIRALCDADPDTAYVDVASVLLSADGQPDPALFLDDALHLNDAGYACWRDVLAPLLRRYTPTAD